MAVRRTPEEIMEIVGHCLELEAEGGDILAYLWSQNYISPRATWCNFQREHLHRKPYQYTDGKPTTKKKRGRKSMFQMTEEIRGEAIRRAMQGEDPRKYLESLGSENAGSVWWKIRKDLKDNYQEIYAQLPKRISAKPPKAKEEPETYEADVIDYTEKTAEAHQEPKPKKAGTVPLRYDGYDVCCIRGKYGEFYYDKTHGYLDWRTNDGEEVSMKPEDWMEFASEEVQKIMGILGAMPAEKE